MYYGNGFIKSKDRNNRFHSLKEILPSLGTLWGFRVVNSFKQF